jgi:hypothetical protein
MKASRSLNKLLEEAHSDLAILVTRTRQLQRWTGILRAQLDSELAPHCYVSGIEDTNLIIYVDTAAWATRLRFMAPQLLPLLRSANPVFSDLVNIKVKVLSQYNDAHTPEFHTDGPTMSSDNAHGINTLSNNIDDPGLQQALQRLARHAKHK